MIVRLQRCFRQTIFYCASHFRSHKIWIDLLVSTQTKHSLMFFYHGRLTPRRTGRLTVGRWIGNWIYWTLTKKKTTSIYNAIANWHTLQLGYEDQVRNTFLDTFNISNSKPWRNMLLWWYCNFAVQKADDDSTRKLVTLFSDILYVKWLVVNGEVEIL
jgi:hypothetical protein